MNNLTAEEREWLQYAIDHMRDDSEPEDATCAAVLEKLLSKSAPAVQGDALLASLVDRWRKDADEIGVSDNTLCQKIANCTMRHAAELQAAIATQQPVCGTPRQPWQLQAADALDVFWNAALGATHQYQDATANAVVSGVVQGVAAVAQRLREQVQE